MCNKACSYMCWAHTLCCMHHTACIIQHQVSCIDMSAHRAPVSRSKRHHNCARPMLPAERGTMAAAVAGWTTAALSSPIVVACKSPGEQQHACAKTAANLGPLNNCQKQWCGAVCRCSGLPGGQSGCDVVSCKTRYCLIQQQAKPHKQLARAVQQVVAPKKMQPILYLQLLWTPDWREGIQNTHNGDEARLFPGLQAAQPSTCRCC